MPANSVGITQSEGPAGTTLPSHFRSIGKDANLLSPNLRHVGCSTYTRALRENKYQVVEFESFLEYDICMGIYLYVYHYKYFINMLIHTPRGDLEFCLIPTTPAPSHSKNHDNRHILGT